jgi:FSR family fosmidomycin resistance protein-like MFS transporter
MGSMREIFGGVVKPLILIWLVIMMRSFVQQAVQTFLPMMAHDVGYGLISIGLILSVYVTSGTASGMLAGWLADRIGFKRVVLITLCLGTPCLLGFFHLPGNWIYLGGFLAGTMLLASMPLTVAMAQELVPKGRSMVASLMMGFAFGIGGMLTPAMGYLAEEIGLRPALTIVAFIPLLVAPLILLCPEKKPAGRDTASAEALYSIEEVPPPKA